MEMETNWRMKCIEIRKFKDPWKYEMILKSWIFLNLILLKKWHIDLLSKFLRDVYF